MNQHPETSSLSEYIPLYLQQGTKNDHVCVAIMFNSYTNIMLYIQLKLMHLYFYTVLERLHTCQYTPTALVKMVTDTEKVKLLILAIYK